LTADENPVLISFQVHRGVPVVARITTVAFQGIEAIPVDVQVLMTPGKPTFNTVGKIDPAGPHTSGETCGFCCYQLAGPGITVTEAAASRWEQFRILS
jgi:hypothetical protein